jgi:hypothetical protein
MWHTDIDVHIDVDIAATLIVDIDAHIAGRYVGTG